MLRFVISSIQLCNQNKLKIYKLMPNLIYCWEEFYRISPKNSKMIECSAMGGKATLI